MNKLYLSQKVARDILAHARAALPYECVGLLFGRQNEVSRRVPLTNVSETSSRYFAAPEELFTALRDAETKGGDLLAIYHSHPNRRQTPSETDVKEARYDAAHLIVVPQLSVLRAFMLNEEVREVDLIVFSQG